MHKYFPIIGINKQANPNINSSGIFKKYNNFSYHLYCLFKYNVYTLNNPEFLK